MPRKKSELDRPDENWLVSYSDMMTLLLYLFIILYALAVVNKGEVQKTVASLYSVFTGGGQIGITEQPGGTGSGNQDTTYDEVNQFITENKLNGKINVKMDENGVLLELQEKVLFNSGSSKIKPESCEVLNEISRLISSMPNHIIIAGHTDNLPISAGYFQSNWELSADRAVKILRYFTDTCKLDPTRFQPIGYGEYKPIADNNTQEGRQKNRRVDIIIVKEKEKNDQMQPSQ